MDNKDPYLLENGVLKNLLGICDENTLEKAVSSLALINIVDLKKKDFPITSCFDILKIHKIIFGDCFEWAGTYRTITMYKAEPILDGCSVDYSPIGYIEKELTDVDNIFKATNFNLLDNRHKITKISEIVAELWRVHPFREGNTRTTSLFLYFLLKQNGFTVRYDFLIKHSKYFRNALVLAALYSKSEPEYLQGIIEDIVSVSDANDDKYHTIDGFNLDRYNFCYHTLQELKIRSEKRR